MFHEVRRATGELLGGSILEPHSEYRTAIGVLGILLPVVLLVGIREIQDSISAYYYTDMRDWFVGTLWVIGVFLFFYRYRPRGGGEARSTLRIVRSGWADAVLGKIAGVSAVIVALVPTAPPAGPGAEPPIIGTVHGIAAVVLFGSLALFPLLLFSQSRTRAGLYRLSGWLMLGLLAAIVAYTFAPESVREALAPWRPVFFLEWALIWTFGFSWLVKGLGHPGGPVPAGRPRDQRPGTAPDPAPAPGPAGRTGGGRR